MKTLVKITMIVLMSAGAWMMPQKAEAQFPGITFQVFYDQLSPYGAWVYDPGYGYVWIPDEGAGFFPYGTGGHWVFTVYGWTWVSDYPWGWAPFHYGRWNFDPYYGWIWVPGNEWGPAWVTWRRCNSYYGWAPLGPGMTIQMTFTPGFFIPDNRWMFVRERDFDRHDLDRHYVGRRDNHNLIGNSRVIENTITDKNSRVTYVSGPDVKEVRSVTGRDIKPLSVKEYSQPGRTVVGKDHIEIYRPPVSREEVNGKKPAPINVVKKNEIKSVSERSKGNLVKPYATPNERSVKEQTQSSGKNSVPKYEKNSQDISNANAVKQEGSVNSVPSRKTGSVNDQRSKISSQRISPARENMTPGSSQLQRTVNPSNQTHLEKMYNRSHKVSTVNEPKANGQAFQKQNGAPQPAQKHVQEPRRENPSSTKVSEQKRTSEPAPAKKSNSGRPVRPGF